MLLCAFSPSREVGLTQEFLLQVPARQAMKYQIQATEWVIREMRKKDLRICSRTVLEGGNQKKVQ